MKRAIFNPLAERELVEAFEFYDQARRGLGDEFLHEVERLERSTHSATCSASLSRSSTAPGIWCRPRSPRRRAAC
jgi:hypothetical protein